MAWSAKEAPHGEAAAGSPRAATGEDRCISCEMTGQLLFRLYSFTKPAAFSDAFVAQQEAWVASCKAASSGRELADCLLIFEMDFRPSFVNNKWKDLRQAWEYKLQSLPIKDCSQVVLLMYEFESYVLWKAVDEQWRKERKQWAKDVRQLYPASLRTLSDAMLTLEKNVASHNMNSRWLSERARWLHRTCYCRNITELAKALTTLESRLGGAALADCWQEERDSWIAGVQSEDVNCCRLATLLLDMERRLLPDVMVPQWQHIRRPWVLSVNNIAGVGR
mmetsp:Transcript_1958/g.7062  ORF Transcript_1958/g.7062 Transcript_1958/m.7062 type:complete len:278 (-) Transcript_1958:116-949(-)